MHTCWLLLWVVLSTSVYWWLMCYRVVLGRAHVRTVADTRKAELEQFLSYLLHLSPELAQVSQSLHLSPFTWTSSGESIIAPLTFHLNYLRWANHCTSHLSPELAQVSQSLHLSPELAQVSQSLHLSPFTWTSSGEPIIALLMYATRCSPELVQVSQLLHLSLMLLVVRSPELVQVVHLNWFRSFTWTGSGEPVVAPLTYATRCSFTW